jgi:hypothetical protein
MSNERKLVLTEGQAYELIEATRELSGAKRALREASEYMASARAKSSGT